MLKFLKGTVAVIVLFIVVAAFSDSEDGIAGTAGVPNSVEMTNFSWVKKGFGNIMEAKFAIKNNLLVAVKDIEVKCTHYSASGTNIDSNRRTIYEIIKPERKRTFRKFDMGFIHSQASKTSCKVVGMTKLT
jgi:hypothetical protein